MIWLVNVGKRFTERSVNLFCSNHFTNPSFTTHVSTHFPNHLPGATNDVPGISGRKPQGCRHSSHHVPWRPWRKPALPRASVVSNTLRNSWQLKIELAMEVAGKHIEVNVDRPGQPTLSRFRWIKTGSSILEDTRFMRKAK